MVRKQYQEYLCYAWSVNYFQITLTIIHIEIYMDFLLSQFHRIHYLKSRWISTVLKMNIVYTEPVLILIDILHSMEHRDKFWIILQWNHTWKIQCEILMIETIRHSNSCVFFFELVSVRDSIVFTVIYYLRYVKLKWSKKYYLSNNKFIKKPLDINKFFLLTSQKAHNYSYLTSKHASSS